MVMGTIVHAPNYGSQKDEASGLWLAESPNNRFDPIAILLIIDLYP